MTRGVYLSVIQDVINKVRPDFINGPGEEELMNLQANWKSKMMLAGVLGTAAVDLNVPPSPFRAPVQPQPQPQQPLPGTGDNLYNNNPTGVPYMQPPYYDMTSQTYQTVAGGFIPQQGEDEKFVKLEVGTPVKVEGVDDEPPLNEDDDDDDLDDVEEEEDMYTQNLVLAQFEKVTNQKGKWKCILKDGIMHMNNKDVLFNKAAGEFKFFH